MWNGSALASYTSYVTREKLTSGDLEATSEIDGIFTVFDSVPNDSSINIAVTGQNNYLAAPDFSNADGRDLFVFQPNEPRSAGYKVNPRVTGRLINYRISSTGYWRLALLGISPKIADRR